MEGELEEKNVCLAREPGRAETYQVIMETLG